MADAAVEHVACLRKETLAQRAISEGAPAVLDLLDAAEIVPLRELRLPGLLLRLRAREIQLGNRRVTVLEVADRARQMLDCFRRPYELRANHGADGHQFRPPSG